MIENQEFAVLRLSDFRWPSTVQLPSKRFRLLVAADMTNLDAEVVSSFASAALSCGMAYFCAWGPDCERLHDIFDEVIVKDELGERRFSGPTANDVIFTTWHSKDSLNEALDFFATCAVPTDGFLADSDFRLAICAGNTRWAETTRRFLQSATFSHRWHAPQVLDQLRICPRTPSISAFSSAVTPRSGLRGRPP
jgi:hypothetical protein